ncbi:hypothetical protein llap_11482 [Limosa lapponica baueri]|uniref:Follistatin-related protein 1 n=1 Tax=Limosa lapponica baueri TaxID=1758121 RepID=A0A2I0TWR4_LIMLA|nr:hypothetical protein llap_11482 [Limosa lapponica baueri]
MGGHSRELAAASPARPWEEPRSKSKICANVFCGAGRECAVTEKGEPTCLCIEKCKPHKRPVCGSNGKTYLNHCELHRDACLTGSKIQVDYDGHCKEKKSENPAASPVVCYQSDRDELRRRVIQWLEAEIIPDGWFSKGSNYSEVLDKYFKANGLIPALQVINTGGKDEMKHFPFFLDEESFDDGDSRLDSTEFLKFVEQNETAVNITTYMDQETNKLLRGLCVDALIELSDENADWKLSFNEFLKCLSPSFNPPEKKCALEDETYEDGAETQVECNRCVCACGNWVCTAMTCEGKNEKVPAQRQRPDQDLTEEELARYVQELQKHQETAEKTKRMSTKEILSGHSSEALLGQAMGLLRSQSGRLSQDFLALGLPLGSPDDSVVAICPILAQTNLCVQCKILHGKLHSLRSLSLHNNLLTYLPREILNLVHLEELSLRGNPLVVRFVRDLTYNPPSLQELAGRTVKTRNVPYAPSDLPENLVRYLSLASNCPNPKCGGVYFDSCVRQIKFVDFCGKYRLPLMHYLCSPECSSPCSSASQSSTSQSESDSEDEASVAARRMQKVLLG